MSEPVALLSRPTAESDTCDDRIDVPINAAVKADAAFVARVTGFGPSGTAGYVRSLIYKDLYGSLKRAEMLVDQLAQSNGRKTG